MVVKVFLENAELNQTSDDEIHNALHCAGGDSVVRLPLWRLGTAIRLTHREATRAPILENRSEPSSDRRFAHGFNVLTSPFRKLRQYPRWHLPACGLR
jgi:hypothetical protein